MERTVLFQLLSKLLKLSIYIYKNNIMSATVDSVEVMGNENNLYFDFGGSVTIARVSKYEVSQVGDEVEFTFMPHKMHFFDKETEQVIGAE